MLTQSLFRVIEVKVCAPSSSISVQEDNLSVDRGKDSPIQTDYARLIRCLLYGIITFFILDLARKYTHETFTLLSLRPIHSTPRKFEDDVFTPKTASNVFVHGTPKKKNSPETEALECTALRVSVEYKPGVNGRGEDTHCLDSILLVLFFFSNYFGRIFLGLFGRHRHFPTDVSLHAQFTARLSLHSGAPAARRAAKRSPILIMQGKDKRNP